MRLEVTLGLHTGLRTSLFEFHKDLSLKKRTKAAADFPKGKPRLAQSFKLGS